MKKAVLPGGYDLAISLPCLGAIHVFPGDHSMNLSDVNFDIADVSIKELRGIVQVYDIIQAVYSGDPVYKPKPKTKTKKGKK